METATRSDYKQRLLEMRSRLITEVRRMGDALTEDIASPHELSDVPTHGADQESTDVEANVSVTRSEGEMLRQVDAALRRIDAGTFGRCGNCLVAIPLERLDAVPYAAFCVRCESKRERSE